MLTDLILDVVDEHRSDEELVLQSNEARVVEPLSRTQAPRLIRGHFRKRKPGTLAWVASVSVGFGSKERPRNGIFGVFPARKMGREPKNERAGWGRGRKEGSYWLSHHFSRGQNSENPVPRSFFAP